LEFVAAFFNREQAANAITSGISARYNRTAELVRAHPPSVSTTEVEPPLVAWLSIYSGTVTIGTTSLREDYTAVAGGKLFVPTVKTYSNLTAFRESQWPFFAFLFDKGAQPAPRRKS
jgi:ABC-type Fe3+-hydroxamate transport system substrate-binding protein